MIELGIKKNLLEKNLNNEEKNLMSHKKKIENQSSLLSDNEIKLELSKYNDKIIEFEKKVQKFNNELSIDIEENKLILINHILDITKGLSKDRDIDMIFHKNSFFLIKEKFDLSNEIIARINNLDIILIAK